MRKFREFSKLKWHNLPVGIMAMALVVSLAIGGTVFAAVALLGVSGTVTVNEAIAVTEWTPTDGTIGGDTWTAKTWTVSIYPGETKSLTVKLTNAGTVSIPVTACITGGDSDLTKTILVYNGSGYAAYGTSYTVVGGGTGYIQFQVTASTSCPPGDQTLTLGISR